MSACGRVQHSYRPRRWQLVALVLLLVTGSAQQLLDGYARDLIGRRLTRNAPASVVRPNGIATAFTYDYAGRLTVVEHADGATMLARYLYGLDENGNRETVSISGTAVTTGTESYTYDALDRLEFASYPGGGSATYTYDANGNRTSVTSGGVVTTYTVDAADQLTALTDSTNTVIQSYGYDANGNRTSSGADSYSYDWANQLSSATVSGATVTYT